MQKRRNIVSTIDKLKALIEEEAEMHLCHPSHTWHVAYDAIQEIRRLENQLIEANALLDAIRKNTRMADLMSWYMYDKIESYFNEIQD